MDELFVLFQDIKCGICSLRLIILPDKTKIRKPFAVDFSFTVLNVIVPWLEEIPNSFGKASF